MSETTPCVDNFLGYEVVSASTSHSLVLGFLDVFRTKSETVINNIKMQVNIFLTSMYGRLTVSVAHTLNER